MEFARRAEKENEVPVGAVIISPQGREIGHGWNRRESTQDPLGHAEIPAIYQAAQALGSWRLLGCTLVVTLEPCLMCLAAAQQARVERVIYGTPDSKGGAISLGYRFHEDERLNHRFRTDLIRSAECESILKEFFQSKRSLANH